MKNKQLNKVDFEIIRYSNLWEDADVLIEGLNLDSKSKVMSIASAGDNCFSMLSQNVKQVIAVDVSAVQLFLVELKKVAISNLNRNSYMKFAGFYKSSDRKEVYTTFKNDLSPDALNYWDNNIEAIEKGIIHCGKFEQYFQLFKNEYLHKIHSQEIIDELFREKSEQDQIDFHDNIWHTEEWKEMYSVFFGRKMLGDRGRDPEFLKHVQGNVSDKILNKEMNAIRKKNIQKNYFLYYILNNNFSEEFLPHYVREENYENVKANLNKLEIFNGLIGDACEMYEDCTHFNLSDIYEYMNEELFRDVTDELINKSAKNAVFAYWNLMIPRSMASVHSARISNNPELSTSLKKKDHGYFYDSIIIDIKK